MVGTGEALGIALVLLADGRTAMTATVLQAVDRAGLIGALRSPAAADGGACGNRRAWQLRLSWRNPDPGLVEDAFESASKIAGS